MLFKGTARRGVGEIARAVEAAGGDINAWTSFDQTVYHLVMASRDLNVGLDILADALMHSAFDAEELAREQEVVLEEIKRTYDSPGRRASRAMFDLAFTTHPYKKPVIGTEETVRGFSRADVVAFYRKHYRPENVTLVCVGDLDPDKTLAEIYAPVRRLAGSGRRAREPVRAKEPPQEGLRIRRREEDLKEVYLDLAWHAPALSHPDVAALDVLTLALGQGESSRLVHQLRRRQHLANDVMAFAYTPKDPGLLLVSAQSPPRRPRRSSRGSSTPATACAPSASPRTSWRRPGASSRPTPSTRRRRCRGRRASWGFFETVAGGVAFEDAYYQRIRQVTADDVRRVARTYLSTEGLTAVALCPEGTAITEDRIREIAEEVERRHAPAKRRARPRNGQIVPMDLSSGARLIVQSDHHVPLVAMRGVLTGGLRFETPEVNGIHLLMARMLTSGTRTRTAAEIARTVDEWAAGLSGVSGRNSFGLGAELLSRHLEKGLQLFTECLTGATYPEDELDKERSQQLEELRTREDDPSGMAFDLFAETRWRVHPYRMDVLGTPESLGRLDAEALRRWHRSHFPVSRLHLGIVGDVDPERARDLAEEALAAAPAPEAIALPEVPVEPPVDGPRRAETHLDKAQAHIVLGYPGITLDDPDRFALEVLSTVLSGQGGRLFVDLRDRRSLAYSVTSFSLEGLDPGYFAVYLGCSPEKVDEAVEGIRRELMALTEAPVEAAELDRARRYLMGAHDIGLQRAGSRAAVMAFNDAYGVGYDAHLGYADALAGVDAEAVLELARRLLDPQREILAIVRPG